MVANEVVVEARQNLMPPYLYLSRLSCSRGVQEKEKQEAARSHHHRGRLRINDNGDVGMAGEAVGDAFCVANEIRHVLFPCQML